MLLYPTRRRLLAATALGAAGLVLDDVLAEPLAPTPQCHDGDAPTVRQGEGPYFKPSSPQRADLVEPNSKARLVELGGQVLTRSCRPVGRALIDLWHSDDRGEYDTAGFLYRGHLFLIRPVRRCLSMSQWKRGSARKSPPDAADLPALVFLCPR
jgi:Dioxygenase